MKKYGNLRERMYKFFNKQSELAEAINLNPATLSKKLNGESMFTTGEIEDICYVLEIPKEEAHEYFFYF